MKNFLLLLSIVAIVILPAYGDDAWVEPQRDTLSVHVGTIEYDKIPEDFECDVTPKIHYDFVARQMPVSYPEYDSLILRIGDEHTNKDFQLQASLWKDEKTSAKDLSYDVSILTQNGTKIGGGLYSPDSVNPYSTLGVAIESSSNIENGVLPTYTRDSLGEIFGDGIFTSYGLEPDGSYQVYVRVFDSDDKTDWISSDRCGVQAMIPVDVSKNGEAQIGAIEYSNIKVSELETIQENLDEVQQIIEDASSNISQDNLNENNQTESSQDLASDELVITAESEIKLISTPLKQEESGISPQDITCRNELEKILKYDGSIVCVKSSSAEKLIQRGYGTKFV